MTTEQKFNCIFCKDVFDNKEELQVHFRKHADPQFKSKRRFEVDSQVSNEKVKDKTEMVSCDVCSQMFPTISKAITHKHKVHPDHDVKYFCPWCGKLFTMKHPYNIHIQTSHEKQETIEDKIFHCDCCDVDFFLPSAMIYHNKFFHRQDTDIPDVGTSRKLRLYNQELIQLHYCSFCGEEYENKINLFKHITDDHGDENQCPEEVLRCPLCEAIFYHLDAYEIHLSFHTTEDLYSGNNELFADLLDFSLETVPPVIEKIEHREVYEAEAPSQTDADADAEPESIDAVGIEKFLELAMDHGEDSNPGKVKKKKHKKSKKAAITLDEFLSMNQDVFGEGLDFQGVEEVPTRVVAKKIKNNKKAIKASASAELEKLKQQGIVVMKVAGTKPLKNAQKNIAKANPANRELKTSSEVLTKLMNQSNNQIKIVKKSISNITNNDTGQANVSANTENIDASEQKAIENVSGTTAEAKESIELQSKAETTSAVIKTDTLCTEDKNENMSSPKHYDTESNNFSGNTFNSNKKNSETYADIECNVNNNDNQNLKKPLTSKLPNENYNKSYERADTANEDDNEPQDDNISDQEETNSDMLIKNNEKISNQNEKELDIHSNSFLDKNSVPPNASPAVNSLTTLKHLSHLTVKPVGINKNNSSESKSPKITELKNDQKPQVKVKEPSQSTVPSDDDHVVSPITPKQIVDNDPTLGALKNLSKNITIKSLSTSTKRNIEESESEDNTEPNPPAQKPIGNVKGKDVSGNKNLTIKKIKLENSESVSNNKVINAVSNAIKNIKGVSKNTPSSPEIVSSKINADVNKVVKTNTDILKHLPNITTKSLPPKKNSQPVEIKQNTTIKTVEMSKKEEEIIEISDIDDSEDDTDHKEAESKPDTLKSGDPLKNLSKHITIKSLNQPAQSLTKNIKVEKTEEQSGDEDDNHAFNSDGDMPTNVKSCSQKLSGRNVAFKNALKNLGKNITVKSRTSSPSQSVKSQDQNSQDYHVNEDASDSDTEIGKVKITEIENDNSDHDINDDDDFDNYDEEQSDSKPIIESPHDSGSDNDEVPEQDFEEEIQASTVQKMNHEITSNKNTVCLNSLKNISKSITIKSLNSSISEKQGNTKAMPSQDGDAIEETKTQAKPSAKKTPQQVAKESSNDNIVKYRNQNFKNAGNIVDHTSNESMNQKVSVNKEVTVKTFQTKTVIQEITTTVTKTIKTVNQTVNKQEMRNSSGQISVPVLPQKVIGMRPSTSKNLQGVVIRHAGPVAVRPRNPGVQIRPAGTAVRSSKQIVPIRPGLNITRPQTPRMPNIKNSLPKSSPNKQAGQMGKPLKFSPSVLTSTIAKRQSTDESSGPFSCFKKPKESLIPVSDVPTYGGGGESVVQMSAASHTSTYSSTSKTVKGNSVVTATQMKSEVTSMQQMSRINNAVGVKVKSAQVKQTQVQQTSECSGMKRTTLEAIERLQKQGLLVKKPRVEENDSDHGDDNVDYNSADEHDE